MQNNDKFWELQEKIGYKFKNIKLLYEAFTHRSYINEHSYPNAKDNERLEFLGDSVMNLMTTEYIYKRHYKRNEGELSKIKSQIISEAVFATIARDLELGKYIFLSNGEINSGGRERNSILGDVFEALVGAVFEDTDFETTKSIFLKLLIEKAENLDQIEGVLDYKTELQELTQMKYKTIPVYELVSESGPDHDKRFEISVKIGDKIYGLSTAKSKKSAEKLAAKIAIENIKGE